MLTLWLSTDRKMNTQRAFSLLCRESGTRQTLLVPEQFSHQTQRAFCAYAGDSASLLAQVQDFSHLARRVFSTVGGIAQTQTDRVGQLLLMALTVEQVRSRLKIYGVGAAKPEFLLQLLDMFEEFRSFCVTPAALRKAAGQLEGLLAQKTEEFALLMESYDAVCERAGQNPESLLTRLSVALQEHPTLCAGERFVFDGFTDFNGIQLEILEQLLLRDADVHIFLQCDTLSRGQQQFAAARETAGSLLRLCRRSQVEYRLQTHEAPPAETPLAFLRRFLFTGHRQSYPEKQQSVVFLRERDTLRLCRLAAGEILRLSAQGVRWRQITVALPDFATWQPVLAAVFRRAGIPAYFAGNQEVLRLGAAQMLLSALEAATGFLEQEAVLAYLKSGLTPISREDCDRLENYILLWNITATRFEQPWSMNPRGLGERFDERAQKELQAIGESRSLAIEPLLRLRKRLKAAGKTADMVLALHDFIEELHLRESLGQKAKECILTGQLQKAQEYEQLYRVLTELLEQMYGVLGSSVRSGEDFLALFRAALSRSSVGTIPAHLDCVNVGSLMSQRRCDSPYVFLLGASEGVFPSGQSRGSLLTDPERGSLLSIGLAMSPTAAGRLERELAAIDSVLNAPEMRLYLGAVSGTESYYFRRAEALFPDAQWPVDERELICRSEREYLSYLTGTQAQGPESLSRQAQSLRRAKDYTPQPLSAHSVEALYGTTLRLSSSKLDALATCPFAYFLKYGLQAQERKTAQFDPTLYGTFVHAVLERTVRQVQAEGGFHQLSLSRVLEISRAHMERCAQEEFSELWRTLRQDALFRRNFDELELVVTELYGELSQSEFVPMWCELHFSGQDGDLPAVRVTGQKMTALLEGYVDRADVWRRGETLYVRVVDYKTGQKKLEYSNLLHGLGLQMLLYLFTLEKQGQALLGQRMEPAGVLYFPARYDTVNLENRLDEAKLEKKRRESLIRNGLILNDEGVLQAMEPCTDEPRYLPYRFDREGIPQGYLASGEQLRLLADFVFGKVAQLGDRLYSGDISPSPYYFDRLNNGCAWCPYASVCRDEKKERWLRRVKSPEEFWQEVEKQHG